MPPPLTPEAQHLTCAGQALREQLHQLDGPAPAAGRPALAGLLAALDEYEAAVLACLPPVPDWQLTPDPTPAQLRAEREADPVYRLGWVRGYQQGQAAGQHQAEPALGLYAQHAGLPAPTDPTALMQQVRRVLAEFQQRYGVGPIPSMSTRRAA